MKIVLASGSPGRYEVLVRAGFEVTVVVPDVDERSIDVEGTEELVLALAAMKGEAAISRAGISEVGNPLVAADTVGLMETDDGVRLLLKPLDREDARGMLSQLRGGWHEFVTGYIVRYDGRSVSGTSTTRVLMRAFSDEELEWYLDTGEWRGKAGAYAIQGAGGVLVERVDGDYFNVMGLPLSKVWEALAELGLRL